MKGNTGTGRGWGRRNGPLWLIFLLSWLLAASFATASPGAAVLRIGSMVPQVTLARINGAPVQIPDSLKGKVVVLHFWQIGCSSCKLEMPAMDVLYKQYRRKGLEVLAVNVGQKKEVVQTFAAELGVSYSLLIDPEEKGARLLGVADVPRTYVIDRNGIVRYRILGGATAEMLKKLILSLI
jgi:cytochrome c biogenesis protein CcmG, thiol:disulfide interchange protein DsbE